MSQKHTAHPESHPHAGPDNLAEGVGATIGGGLPEHYRAPSARPLGSRFVPLYNELLRRYEPNRGYFMVYELVDAGDGQHYYPVLISCALINTDTVN
ncbi:MAG: hypothetical protein IPM23_03890 [Candidatus Melainabacteria bacterium]|nr:hypothetical protein [Candidatus Melainabacteria bacterium]